MKRETKLKNPEDYDAVITRELEYFQPMARDMKLSDDVVWQASRLGVRDGIFRHRDSTDCKYREEECVRWNIRHMVGLLLVRAALLASSEEEMEKAETVLMRLIED